LTPNLNLKRLLERAAVLLCALPRSELLLRDFPRYAVHLADLFREPLAVAGDDFELFLAQLDPVALGVALEVLPVHFDASPVHAGSYWRQCAEYGSDREERLRSAAAGAQARDGRSATRRPF